MKKARLNCGTGAGADVDMTASEAQALESTQATVIAQIETTVTAQSYLAAQSADVQTRWANSALAAKTPAEIYNLMQTAIDNWGTLAAAQADLRVWLPLMAAGMAWMVMER
jgi:hypothetical protein